MSNLAYELRKCKECSCSRCHMNATQECYIEEAIRQMGQDEKIIDTFQMILKNYKGEENDN